MNMLNMTTLSYFTGEQHSENFEQIIHLAEELGYSVRVYETKESSQFDFLQAIYRDTATVVDVTIPNDLTQSTVYPLLTAHINILDHILVFSDKQYEDGAQVLPLNITPQRVRTDKDKDLLGWLKVQLEDLKAHQYYDRFEIESIEKLAEYKLPMEKVIAASLELHKPKKEEKMRVMISYRNSCSMEVELFRKREEAKGEVEIKVLPPGSLCDDFEAHTPMRRWMLVGLLDGHIREVDEVWVYYNDIYSNSWWTLAELVMVAYINYDREEKDKVKVKVYDAGKKRFIEENEEGYPTYLHIQLTDSQHQKLARYLANSRPDVIIDSEMRQHICNLKKVAKIMRFIPRSIRIKMWHPIIEKTVPDNFSEDEKKKMVDEIISMYCNPKSLMAYANEAVFDEDFSKWSNISYQVDFVTTAFKDDIIDIDEFMDAPMQELNKFDDKNLINAVDKKLTINLKGKHFHIRQGKKRYIWFATRMGEPVVKDAPGLAFFQTYNLVTHE